MTIVALIIVATLQIQHCSDLAGKSNQVESLATPEEMIANTEHPSSDLPVAKPAIKKPKLIRSLIDEHNWILGNPNNVFWFSLIVAYVAFRAFRAHSPHHEVGCVAAVASAIVFFILQVASGIDGNVVMSLSVAGLAYAATTVGCWFNEKRLAYAENASSRVQPAETAPTRELSEQLSAIQTDLDSQLKSIAESPFDSETLDDLKETAKQAAVERMARILESD